MRVRTRVISVLSGTLTLLSVALLLVVHFIIVESFQKIEQQGYERNIDRVHNAVEIQLDSLNKKAIDWGQWDDTYNFMADRPAQYLEETLNYPTITAVGFRDVIYFDLAGNASHSAHLVAASEKVIEAPFDLINHFQAVLGKDRVANIKRHSGLTQINGETLLYSFTDILPSKRNQPSRGTLLVTSLVSNEFFTRWAHQTNLDLKFWRFAQETPSPEAALALSQLAQGQKYYPIVEDTRARVFGLLHDDRGQPALLFEFVDNRRVTNLAKTIRDGGAYAVLLSGAIALALLWLMINKQVISRLAMLNATVTQIANTGDTHLRVADPHKYRQSLRLRTFVTVTCCYLLMGSTLWLMFNGRLETAFNEIEVDGIENNLIRAQRALGARTEELLGKTVDWAQWDATYKFVDETSKDYIDTNLNYETLAAMRIRGVGYFSPTGEFKYGVEVNSNAATTAPMSEELKRTLQGGVPILANGSSEELVSGLVRYRGGVAIITRSPILDSGRAQPSKGSFVFVMSVDQQLIDELSKQTRLNVSLYPSGTRENTKARIEVISPEYILGRTPVKGLSNENVATIQIMRPRDVHLQGLAARNTLLLCIVLSSVVAILITVAAVNRIILSTLKAAVDQVQEISRTGDMSHRLGGGGTDELGMLATQINSMLDTITRTQHELQIARDRAQAADAAKSTFIAKVSHELRTPIHGVVGMLRILMKEESSKSKKSYIAMAKNSAYGLLDTINEILDFSKMESGNLSLESIEFDLRDAVRDALRTVAPRAEEKGTVELIADVLPGVPERLMGDPLRLKQCLINLLGNAVKFTKEGFVKLTILSEGQVDGLHKLVLAVSDSGVGIPQERLPMIFEPFTQADDSVARVFTGTGLGLTIVKQLVEQMNGEVIVTSELGKGTVFTMNIALPEVASHTWEDASVAFSPANVAIIDGTSQAVLCMHEGLARYGVESTIVQSEDPQAVAALAQQINRFGLVMITTEAIKKSHVFNFVVEMAAKKRCQLAVILSPFEIGVRERLSALSVPYVFMRPISAEDVLLSVSGRLKLDEAAWESDDAVSLVSSRKLKILIADDAETNRIILSSMLEEAGHEVTCVINGLDLVAALKGQVRGSPDATHFDVVLTDIQMPLMDGITATREVRRLESEAATGRHIPIIAVTAHAMTEEKNHMRQSGIDDVVTKPIEPLELARLLGEVTGIGSAAPAATEPSSAGASHAKGSVETVPQSEVDSLKDMAYRLWLQLEWDDSASNGGAPSGESEFEQILDIADTYSRSGESARRTRLIFNAFLSSFKDPLAELHQAKTEGDCDKLKRASHALKGLLLDIGAKRAGKLAGAIEQSSKDEKFDEGAQHITSLSTQALTVARLVEKLVEALPAGKHKAKETAVVVTEQALMLPTPSLPMPAGPVDSAKFVALAHHAVKETIVTLSDIELRNLVPANILAAGGGHPAIELVYQLLDVHGVVAREGHNTARSLLVFGAFLHGYEDLLRELDRSSGERDLDNLKAVSRALRDVLADTGCPLGADIAHQIEQLCELGSAPEALALCESLKIQTHLVGKMVRRIMDEAGA